jgi:predicted acetyltransferase
MPEPNVAIRACRPDEFARFSRVVHQAFGQEARDEEVERARRILPADRALAAFVGDAIVGGTATFPFSLSVPGGEVPAGGVTMVGVLPTHRRRGVLTRLMRAQLDDGSSRAEPVAVLWASEGSIYGRFGYGMATKAANIDIERERTTFASDEPSTGRVRLLTLEEAAKSLPEVYERVRMTTPGMFARTRAWWEAHTLADPPEERDGGGPRFVALWEEDARAQAYALYRVHGDWSDGVPGGWLDVDEAMGVSPRATREIWRFLFGVDLVARIRGWKEPADHPLLLMLAEPRRLRLRIKDGLWLRIIDLERALEARAYAADGTLSFDLQDELCPRNAGRWRLEVSGGRGRARRSTGEPDLVLTVSDLASAYLGGVAFSELARAGRIRAPVTVAVDRATAMFASPQPPWCPEIF